MVNKSYILFLLFVLPSFLLHCQDYIADVHYYGVEEGLSHREVYCTYQDNEGFIWIGTKYGLNRFDGKEFILYTKEKNGIASNEIHQIFQDQEGWLWLISVIQKFENTDVSQISLLNPSTGEVHSLETHFGEQIPFSASNIYHCYINELNKTIVLGSKNGEIFIYENGKTFREIKNDNWSNMYPWLQLDNGSFIVETSIRNRSAQSYTINEKGEILNSWDSFRLQLFPPSKPNKIQGYFRPPQSFTNYSINFVDFPIQDIPNPRPLTLKGQIGSLNCDDWSCKIYFKNRDQTYWYKSESRFFVFNRHKELIFDFNLSHSDIAKNEIQDIYFDKSGRTWIATSQGFYIIRLNHNPFKRLLYNSSSDYDTKNFISCRGLLKHGEKLWVGTELQKNYKIDLGSGAVEVLPFLQIKNKAGNPMDFEGRTISPFSPQHLLFGENTLCHYKISDASYQIFYWEDGAYNTIWSLYKDKQGFVWIGSYDGPLGYWKPNLEAINIYKKWNNFELPKGGYIYSFLEIDAKNMLIGTSFGIYLLNQKDGMLNRFWTGGEGNSYFPTDNVFHFNRDKKEKDLIWIATGGGGLISWKISDIEKINTPNLSLGLDYRQFTVADGLSNNTIYAVYQDDYDNLWLPSDYGIIQFNKEAHFSKAFLVKDGITYNEFNRISHHQDEKGNLYFGGLNGITAFHPNDFNSAVDTLNIPLRITSFQQYNSETELIEDKTTILQNNPHIILKPGDRFFNLKFALLEYQNSSRVRYAYKIEEQEKEWNVISDNSLRISGLNYGNYRLRIKGQGANGQFSRQELSIPISVLKPFYLKTWFIILSILGFLTFVFAFYKYRTSQFKRQQLQLEKMVQERTETIEKQKEELKNLDKVKSRFFANVSHELRTPLTLMLGPLSTVIKSNKLDNKNFTLTKVIQSNTQNLLKLVNEILDLTKLESGKLEIHESPTPLYSFSRRLVAAFESHAQRQNIQLEYHFLPDKYLQVLIDQNKFEKILNNLLSNALKFTDPEGKIKVEISDTPKGLQLKVNDTGRGIHPEDLQYIFDRYYQPKLPHAQSEGGTGIGLALCMEFSKLMKGSIRAESTLGKGSTFYFEFPKKEVLGAPKELAFEEIEQSPAEVNIESSLIGHENGKVSASTILVVEDNYNLRDYLKLILSEKYQVITAENGKVAWNLLNVESKPNLIISDIMMPEMDGYQFLDKLKGHEQLRHLPVIMLTARAEIKDKLKALRIGVDDYMLKPFEEEELMTRVENLLKNRSERLEMNVNLEKEHSENDLDLKESEKNETISKRDLEWLEELEHIVFSKLSNFDFDTDFLASEIGLSRRQLNRRIQSLTGLTASKYILEARLNKAREYLENQTFHSVKAIAYEVGFKYEKYFGQKYKERFGKLPSAYF